MIFHVKGYAGNSLVMSWNNVANVQDISCGRVCRKFVGHVTWNDVQDISCGRLCRKFVGHVIWNDVANVQNITNDRDTGHLFQNFMYFHNEM